MIEAAIDFIESKLDRSLTPEEYKALVDKFTVEIDKMKSEDDAAIDEVFKTGKVPEGE